MLHHSTASYSYTYLTDISQNAKVHRDEHETSNTRAVQYSAVYCAMHVYVNHLWAVTVTRMVHCFGHNEFVSLSTVTFSTHFALLAFGYFETYELQIRSQKTKTTSYIAEQRAWSLNWSTHSPLGLTVYFTHSFNFNMAVGKRNGISKLRVAFCSWHIHLGLIVFDIIEEKDYHNTNYKSWSETLF